LYAAIDETAFDDADYIRSVSGPSSDTCKIKLSTPGSGVTTPIELRVRYGKTGPATINLTVKLLEGTTEVWSQTYNNVSASFVTVSENVTPSPSISDASNLYIQFIATAA
jgi:hypothetical protein